MIAPLSYVMTVSLQQLAAKSELISSQDIDSKLTIVMQLMTGLVFAMIPRELKCSLFTNDCSNGCLT